MQTKRVRGVRDILPKEAEKISFIEHVSEKWAERFGFKRIILPIIENIQLYHHSLGQTSDIVEKQMFILQNRNPQDDEILTLRPEGTAGMVRALIENNMKNQYPLKRFFYFGPMFRYERPQKGRYREFYQFGFEIFEEPPIGSDLILITLINNVLKELEVDFILEVNTIGCPDCRKQISDIVKNELNKIKEYLCETCKVRLDKNPLRIFDCKQDIVAIENNGILNKINIQNLVCKRCKNDFEILLNMFDNLKISYKTEPKIVRGLDYYNGFVFEYRSNKLNAAQNTICAGGRYDFLINQFDKQINFACGAALGVDRISEIISQPKNFNKEKIKIGIAIISDEFLTKSFEIIKRIFESFKDFIVVGPFMKRSLKSQMRLFNNENCKYVIIIGDELKENKITIKDFTNNTQKTVNITELTKFLTYYE